MAGDAPQGPDEIGLADVRVVFDLLEDLRAAWEKILNDYAAGRSGGQPVSYLDGWMACHSFFKLALDHLVADAGLTGEAAAQVYLGAAETFRKAMAVRAEQVRAR